MDHAPLPIYPHDEDDDEDGDEDTFTHIPPHARVEDPLLASASSASNAYQDLTTRANCADLARRHRGPATRDRAQAAQAVALGSEQVPIDEVCLLASSEPSSHRRAMKRIKGEARSRVGESC